MENLGDPRRVRRTEKPESPVSASHFITSKKYRRSVDNRPSSTKNHQRAGYSLLCALHQTKWLQDQYVHSTTPRFALSWKARNIVARWKEEDEELESYERHSYIRLQHGTVG